MFEEKHCQMHARLFLCFYEKQILKVVSLKTTKQTFFFLILWKIKMTSVVLARILGGLFLANYIFLFVCFCIFYKNYFFYVNKNKTKKSSWCFSLKRNKYKQNIFVHGLTKKVTQKQSLFGLSRWKQKTQNYLPSKSQKHFSMLHDCSWWVVPPTQKNKKT